MWTSHFAPAFFLKPSSPETPISLFALAGILPDVLWLINCILGYEQISYRGPHHYRAFNYDGKYPYTHSITGLVSISIVFALIVSLVRGLSVRSFITLSIAGLSHWYLDAIAHRGDMPLSPTSKPQFGLGLFDYPDLLFLVDYGILFSSMLYYYAVMPGKGLRLMSFGILFALLQAAFTFFDLPGRNARFCHTSIMLLQMLGVCWGMECVEGKDNMAVVKGSEGLSPREVQMDRKRVQGLEEKFRSEKVGPMEEMPGQL